MKFAFPFSLAAPVDFMNTPLERKFPLTAELSFNNYLTIIIIKEVFSCPPYNSPAISAITFGLQERINVAFIFG